LNHWFAAFPPDQIGRCLHGRPCRRANSEEQTHHPFFAALAVSRGAAFFGLDPALAGHFEAAVARGKFNAAAHRGYEAVTPWEAARASEVRRTKQKKLVRLVGHCRICADLR
jgi:hypothetical protein